MGKPDKQTQRAVQGDPNQRQTRPRQDDPDLNPQQQQPGERQAGQTRDYDAGERNGPGEHGQPNRPQRPQGERRDPAGNQRGGLPDERIQPQR